MKTSPQNTQELEQLCRLITDMNVAMLTTLDDLGSLTSRPMSPLEMDSDGALWFFTEKSTAKTQHLKAVNLAFSNESHGTYVSLSGRGEIHTDRESILRLWTPFAKPWFPDGPDSPNLALFKFIPHAAEYWDAPDSKMVRMFAMAASVIAGKAVGLGDHNTLTDLSTV